MTPSARTKAVLDILQKLDNPRLPMDAIIGDYMRFRRYIGSKDRSFIVETAYQIIRSYARITWWLQKQKQEDTARNRLLIWLLLDQKKSEKDLKSLFDGSKYGPDPLTDDELGLIKTLSHEDLNHKDMPDSVRCECPAEQYDFLKQRFNINFVEELQAMLEPATLDLRVNTRSADIEKVIKSMEIDNIKADPTPYSPWGLRLQEKAYLSRTKAFSKGWVEIQDEGSQLIAVACDVKPGMQVLDYCAGAGGKTLALAAAMQNKGRLVATDIDTRRLEKSKDRFKRAGVHDIIERRSLSEEKNRKWLRRQKETFDVVLVDVPCSGTGTWRRNPDSRWFKHGPALEELLEIQAEILEKIKKCVKPGGRLVYATCSLLPQENEDQVQRFLSENSEFILRRLPEIWPENLQCPCDADYMHLTPNQHNTDGFFAAIMEKRS